MARINESPRNFSNLEIWCVSDKIQDLGFIAEVYYVHVVPVYVNLFVLFSLLLVVPCHTAILSVQKTFKGNVFCFLSFFVCIHYYDIECCFS